jgi:hypothetical protein
MASPESDRGKGRADPVSRALGSGRAAGTRLFLLFVPSVDRIGKGIDHEYWVDEALTVFATLFRGATAYPRGRGKWRDDERGGQLVTDEPTMVISYAEPKAGASANLRRLRALLHRMGREARQGEVGIVIDGEYRGITEYDEEVRR